MLTANAQEGGQKLPQNTRSAPGGKIGSQRRSLSNLTLSQQAYKNLLSSLPWVGVHRLARAQAIQEQAQAVSK
jgi:hypothetical protein